MGVRTIFMQFVPIGMGLKGSEYHTDVSTILV